jgi:hypothetical protein
MSLSNDNFMQASLSFGGSVQDGSGRFSSKQLHSGQVAVVHGLNHHHDAGYGQRTIHDLHQKERRRIG